MKMNRLTKHWDSLAPDEMRSLQGHRLARYLTDHVVPFSTTYREIFRKEGIDPRSIRSIEDLIRIPFTSKREGPPDDNAWY